MSLRDRIAGWLDVRPGELRKVSLSFTGAFAVVSFLILARSLREALYLDAFPVETLPYITVAAVVLGLPSIVWFTRLLGRQPSGRALRDLSLVLAAGLLVLWPLIDRSDAAVVVFYLWTVAGTLLLTSGFWIVTSEQFQVRQAKRLFGLISGGGTLGALVTGTSVSWLVQRLDTPRLVPLLVLLLALLLGTQFLLPLTIADGSGERAPAGVRDGLSTVWRHRHLRLIALIIFAATVASTLVDYQFKEAARGALVTRADLAGFFGAFYGWTGGLALAVQLGVTARLMTGAGVTASVAVLPVVLLLGSAGILAAPGLMLATLVRGADNTLRKSLHRSVVEFLYVPLPASLRRRTKALVDSFVDSAGEALGAGIVFLWVTLPGFSSRWLSVFVILCCLGLLGAARAMGGEYFRTLRRRLAEGDRVADGILAEAGMERRDLLSATFTRLDVSRVFDSRGISLRGLGLPLREDGSGEASGDGSGSEDPAAGGEDDPERILSSADVERIVRLLAEREAWDAEQVPALTRLLARDRLLNAAVRTLREIGDAAVPHLAERLVDESGDFVIRRRIPRVLARCGGEEADRALLEALTANRFEVRYRSAIALATRRREGMPVARGDWKATVWDAIRAETGRERPVWELQRLLDEAPRDEFVEERVGRRGELSLEHSFRMLSLVLDPATVRSAYRGLLAGDPELRSFALEYLEQVLPTDVRRRLWPFIGDLSAAEERRSLRPLDDVVSDLLETGATLFAGEEQQRALRRFLRESDPESTPAAPEDGETDTGPEQGPDGG